MEFSSPDPKALADSLRALPPALAARLRSAVDCHSLEAAKAEFFGPHGAMTLLCKSMATLPKADRPAVGRTVNAVRAEMESALAAATERVGELALAEKLGARPDPTLSPAFCSSGLRHPLSLVRDRAVEIFHSMGFSVAEATEVETEWHCFDALNMPQSHAARDCMDTFYLGDGCDMLNVEKYGAGDGRYLLRTHTTSVQVRELRNGKLPLRVIAPGRVFRRDTVDATHSANFHQVDVVDVGRGISVAHLRSTIDFFLRRLLGAAVETRYRPSYFPFTEPSFEVDVRSPNLGKLSGTWIEILGCGLIHPNVFAAVAIDSEEWSGQAWGIGLERIAMLLYGIDDVRHFYRNDRRFLRQFN
ncbi:MAG: phenylalanine--tRNA ligase subunit alpha [Puniceicoccales bacterium]|jgi:phenylalanyl-tRNA synthetase alpha chain|nr:phenylalanine--tRNA ligase subunit alpha [Puniceicoccales bacterium]